MSQTLQYFVHDGPSAIRVELAGDLDQEGARRLEGDWRTAASAIGSRELIVDLTYITNADEAGRSLLARWYAKGARLIAGSKIAGELAGAIAVEPVAAIAKAAAAHAGSFTPPKLCWTLLIAALFPLPSSAANLKPETVAAWDGYVKSVSASLEERTRAGGTFLWTDENPERVAKVHGGEIVVAPAPGPMPRKVPGGLIHHWGGAAFFPNVGLNEILEVTRDYDRFQDFYRPSVIASKTGVRTASADTFSMMLMNKVFFLKTALDADYQATNVRLDGRRFYSVSRTTRVQEIEDGRRIPEGEGGGYIWKLFSIIRLEQRDGGVYVEMEVAALSRDIPAAVRLVVDPIVRRVARNSMLTSIKQTQDAVFGNSVSAEHSGSGSAPLKNSMAAFAGVSPNHCLESNVLCLK